MSERPIIQRKYDIDEIDMMRESISRNWFYDEYNSYDPTQRAIEVEEILRTYMMAGIDPEKVKKEGMRRSEEHWKREEDEEWEDEPSKPPPPPPPPPKDWDASGVLQPSKNQSWWDSIFKRSGQDG